ncbi:protein PIMREG [Castor canadensis]|uniref:Protein FAM64A n=1 Tax=Castor canadensis TaxID=51338 RepID=A0A8C0WGS8_CASCN|nr:protein FAM64A [Castor canadensis]
MTSQWQGMKASACRRSILKDEPSEEMQSATCHLETTTGALGSLCRQFQRRLPLRAVSLNLGAGPSWKRLETPTPEPEQQGLQAAARSAKNALGAMSQKIQQSCQSGTKWLMETQVTARRRKRGVQKGRASPPPNLSQKNTRLSGAAWDPREREHRHPSAQVGTRAHQRRWLRREAAFRSPYSSTEPLCSPSESDSDLEPVGAGIQHLQKLSQKLDEAIMATESGNMAVPLIHD